MIFLIIGILFIVASVGLHQGINRAMYGVPPKRARALSWPSKRILEKYNQLPEENRPHANIVYILEAMDTQWGGKDKVNELATRTGWDSSYKSWFNVPRPYHTLFDDIKAIETTLEKREQDLKLIGARDGLEGAKQLTEALRREQRLIADTTKQIMETT